MSPALPDNVSDHFVWNDGGRAACGFVGTTGDCVTRAIAIATGSVYRDVYREIGQRTLKSPRTGVAVSAVRSWLAELGWQHHPGNQLELDAAALPRGIVIVHAREEDGRGGHMFAMIDHVVHDTWNACQDHSYRIEDWWTPPESSADSQAVRLAPHRPHSQQDALTQREFDKILKRLRALDNTAKNSGSTEGEKRNALRMMQSLMLTHNLSREDLVDDQNIEHIRFTRMACPLNGRRACAWEKSLAFYVVRQVFPMVQFYMGVKGHRTFFWFYGPVDDVTNTVALFRELVLTIATSARLHYGSYARGSGASYAEGYVAGLPRYDATKQAGGGQGQTTPKPTDMSQELSVVQSRAMVLHSVARDWLYLECNTRLASGSRSGRYRHDAQAAQQGHQHGSQHDVQFQGQRPRLGKR